MAAGTLRNGAVNPRGAHACLGMDAPSRTLTAMQRQSSSRGAVKSRGAHAVANPHGDAAAQVIGRSPTPATGCRGTDKHTGTAAILKCHEAARRAARSGWRRSWHGRHPPVTPVTAIAGTHRRRPKPVAFRRRRGPRSRAAFTPVDGGSMSGTRFVPRETPDPRSRTRLPSTDPSKKPTHRSLARNACPQATRQAHPAPVHHEFRPPLGLPRPPERGAGQGRRRPHGWEIDPSSNPVLAA